MLSIDIRIERGTFTLEVDAEIEAGTLGVFGPSGSGKTTLLHAIAGLAPVDAGRIVLDGDVLTDTRMRTFVPPHRRGIGIVFQDGRLFPHLSVRGNLRYGERHAPYTKPNVSADEIVELLDLSGLLGRRPATLSGGERQHVALARALLAAPRLLLLDEPLASIDRARRRAILPYLLRLRERTNIPTLYVSHELDEVLHLTDRLLLLDEGRTVGHGALADLATTPDGLTRLGHAGLLNVLDAHIVAHDAAEGITRTRLGSGDAAPVVRIPLIDAPAGTRVQLALRPEDIALVTGEVHGISMQNDLAGTVERTGETTDRVLALVRLEEGPVLMAEVTPHARRTLGVDVGARVRCLFKAQAIAHIDR